MSKNRAPTLMLPLALVLLLWHAALAADYAIARFALDLPGWPAVLPALPAGPVWLTVAWAMAVWLGLIAAIFLMLRDDASVLLFFSAFVAQIVATVGLRSAEGAIMGLPIYLVTALCAVPPLVGWLYARALNRRGYLH